MMRSPFRVEIGAQSSETREAEGSARCKSLAVVLMVVCAYGWVRLYLLLAVASPLCSKENVQR